jgi:hypothetical protein
MRNALIITPLSSRSHDLLIEVGEAGAMVLDSAEGVGV